MTSRTRTVGMLLAAGALVLTGCDGAAAPEAEPPVVPALPQEYAPPAEWVGYSTVWDAVPGIDLTSPVAVVARAMVESFAITGVTDDIDAAYPGFARAVSGSPIEEDFNRSTRHAPRWVGGTQYRYLTRIEPLPDGLIAVTYCIASQGRATKEDGGYRNTRNGDRVGTVLLQPPVDEARWRTSEGTGPRPYPVTDVFGEWTLAKTRVGNLVTAEMYAVDDQACAEHNASLNLPAPGLYDEPFPVHPAVPGWPAMDQP